VNVIVKCLVSGAAGDVYRERAGGFAHSGLRGKANAGGTSEYGGSQALLTEKSRVT
jgi:hypothetical protein